MADIIIESHIPFADGILDRVANVKRLAPAEITPETVRNADALVVRTRTRCNEALLAGSRVKAIATATIGTDHIDLDYCRQAGIFTANAPGCNAPAVAQYVLSAINTLTDRARGTTIGIVGVGHVGKIVEAWARAAGFTVLLCDPPRAEAEGRYGFSDLSEIADKADIITFHTPLDPSTRHMADTDFFRSLRRRPIVINAARGPITDTEALLTAIATHRISAAVIDCWEKEPDIDRELLRLADIATPHIAGYSLEGKRRATAMALNAIIGALNLPTERLPVLPVPATPSLSRISESYNPLTDTAKLKSSPESFEDLRNHYEYRPEP